MRRYPSGQRGQTVNLLALVFAGSNPARRTRKNQRKLIFLCDGRKPTAWLPSGFEGVFVTELARSKICALQGRNSCQGGTKKISASADFFYLTLIYTYVYCNYFVAILCGLWFGQALSLHRSGMVFVPSIMSAPQVGQRLPVGRALMAYLHFG